MDFALPLARACATLRQALQRGQTTGQLEALDIPREALRAFSTQVQWVGRSPQLEQGLEIVMGQPLFASDVRIEGMVFGRVLRAAVPPEIDSRLSEIDEPAARAVPGFVAVVRHPALKMASSEGLGIVATTPGALDRIEQALKPRWIVEGQTQLDALAKKVDIDQRLAARARRDKYIHDEPVPEGHCDVDLRIDIPIAAHAAIEPRVAVAKPIVGGLEMWVG